MKQLIILCVSLICTLTFGQNLSTRQKAFLIKSATLVKADSISNTHYWEGLGNAIRNKRIVLLGEFTHGASEISTLRNDLIRYLHQKKGFNVILFESGIGEVVLNDFRKEKLSPKQMTYGFIGPWRTQEFVELMTYVKSNDLSIARFDVQRSDSHLNTYLKRRAKKKSLTLYFI